MFTRSLICQLRHLIATSFVPIAAFTPPSGLGGFGSSNYITNFAGEVSQHSEYFAFGETFIEEHKNSHNAPYKFNGKELDEESGLYYYGARYFDPKLSLMISTDQLMEKFAGHSPYEYCFSNPVRYIDPTGMSPEDGDGDPPKKKNIIAIVDYSSDIQHDNRNADGNSDSPDGVDDVQQSAMISAQKTNTTYFLFKSIEEFKEKYNASFGENEVLGDLTIVAHGGYYSGLYLGDKTFLNTEASNKKLGGIISTHVSKNQAGRILLISCNVLGGNNQKTSIQRVQALSDSSGMTVLGSQSYGLTTRDMFNAEGNDVFYPTVSTSPPCPSNPSPRSRCTREPNAILNSGKWGMIVPNGNGWFWSIDKNKVWINKEGTINGLIKN